jgi:5-methylcytosine-specific restriction endonuclease McrA
VSARAAACGVCGDVAPPIGDARLGTVCGTCLSERGRVVRPSAKDDARKRRAERRAARAKGEPGGDPAVARQRERELARSDSITVHDEWATSHAGYPLGVGYPTGASMREDGETHREAWKRIVRGDACAYCGRLPFPCRFHGNEAGTVDHVDPQSGPRPVHGLHSWTNYSGACGRCNSAKKSEPLLVWLARRPVLR